MGGVSETYVFSAEQIAFINFYCQNEMRELKKICDPLIYRKRVPQVDWDDMYSLAMDTLIESVKSYDPKRSCSFKTFLTGNIKRSFYDYTRNEMRGKRCNLERNSNGTIKRDKYGKPIPISNFSLEAENEDGISLKDVVSGGDIIEEKIFAVSISDNTTEYIESLNPTQRNIAWLLMRGYERHEIKKMLNLSDKEYTSNFSDMKSYEKKRILFTGLKWRMR